MKTPGVQAPESDDSGEQRLQGVMTFREWRFHRAKAPEPRNQRLRTLEGIDSRERRLQRATPQESDGSSVRCRMWPGITNCNGVSMFPLVGSVLA